MENNNFLQAVILAGGRGERLKPITNSIPKPMAPINQIPFLDYLISSIYQVGINNILILVGYKSSIIIDRYKKMKNIKFSVGTEFDETGRRLLNAYNQLNDNFLFVYGDNYWPIELEKMKQNFNKLNVSVTTTVFSNKNGTGEYGYKNNIKVGSNGLVVKYDKKRQTQDANGVDIGYFLMNKGVLNPQISDNVSFELDILPILIEEKKTWSIFYR